MAVCRPEPNCEGEYGENANPNYEIDTKVNLKHAAFPDQDDQLRDEDAEDQQMEEDADLQPALIADGEMQEAAVEEAAQPYAASTV